MRTASDENSLLLAEIVRLYGLVLRASREAGDDAAMTTTQRLALVEVTDAGPLRLRDLAARMGTSPPTASRAVDALVEAGFAERVTDERDRRALQIAVTRRGRVRVDARRARIADSIAPAFVRLAPRDRARLVGLLRSLNDELAANDALLAARLMAE